MPRILKLNFLLLIICMVCPCLKGFAQTDDQSNGQYREVYINRTWERLDKNKDGQFTEEDNKRIWKRFKRVDSNEDNQVSFEEYVSKVQVPYLNTGGKRKLNVLYKVTEEEDLYLDIYYPEETYRISLLNGIK